ncbi:unnamed protein product, partial [Rotaria sp. Silwood1]
ADWWSIFGIPTQTLGEKCYSMQNFVACKECKTVYRYSRTTSSDKIKKHECYLETIKQQNTKNSLSAFESTAYVKSTQSTLSNYSFGQISNHGSGKNIKSKCSDLIVDWISSNIRPLGIVEDAGLHELLQFFYELGIKMKDANLKINNFIPSRYTISRNIHSIAEQTRAKFKELLLEPLKNDAVTLSPDLWTDRFKQISYLGITATLINSLHKYQTITLCCTEFTENEKTANNIEKMLKNCLSVYGITNLADVNWVCDRGANILKCFKQNNIEPIKCYAHRLNGLLSYTFINKDADVECEEELLTTLMNVIDQIFEESIERQRLLETINSCKILVKYAKKAGLIEIIKHQADKNGGSGTSLKQQAASRWLSLYNCLESILDNYEAITIVLKEKNKLNLVQIISKLVVTQLLILLLPLRCATRDIQNDQHPTLYLVQPFHQLLIRTYSSYTNLRKFALDFDAKRFKLFCDTYPNEDTEPSGVKFFREQIHELLMEMDTSSFFDDKHYFATFLHPKHRDMKSISTTKKFEILTRLRSILFNMKPVSNSDNIVNSNDQEEQRKKFKSLNYYLADFEDDTIRKTEQTTLQNDDDISLIQSSQAGCHSPEYAFMTTTYQVSKPDEIDQYCAMKIPCHLIGKDPMLFWSQKYVQETLPLLSRYARTIHAIPPTSASTERLFSISGHTLNNRRTNLLLSDLDDILVIRSGVHLKVEKPND